MPISYINAYLRASACMYMQTQAYKHKKSAKTLAVTTNFPKMHVCATARHNYITLSFGLNVFIKNFSFTFRLTVYIHTYIHIYISYASKCWKIF